VTGPVKFSAKASLALWKRRLPRREKLLAAARKRGHADEPGRVVTHKEAALIHKREAQVAEAKKMIAKRRAQLAVARPLRVRAHDQAVKLIGVMEQGSNNMGPQVSAIIRNVGGTPGEAWCGDFMAYVYKLAGSKVIDRNWAYVPFMSRITGVKKVAQPTVGDIVRFEFTGDSVEDHTGMFEKDNGDGTITTIEGNTGATGAVSDSKTGGDGVYRKVRSKRLVRDYLRVTR
jgi:hypothetical protein